MPKAPKVCNSGLQHCAPRVEPAPTLNLIVNAIQSMSGVEDDDRELQVGTVSIDPEGVRVVVRDTEESTQLEVWCDDCVQS